MPFDLEGDRLALLYRCPTCMKLKGQVCVYVAPRPAPEKYTSPNSSYSRQLARAGTPTPRPHNERRSFARQQEAFKRYRTASQESIAVLRASASQRQIARAQNEFLLREYMQLKVWLRRYGQILIS